MAKQKDNLSAAFEGHMTTGQLIKYVLPTIVTVVFACLYGIVDGIFVSNVGGSVAFAAVNLTSPIFLILSSVGMMFGTGGNAIISKLRGEGKEDEAKKIFSTLTFAVIIIGIALTIIMEIFFPSIVRLLGADGQMFDYCIVYGRVLMPFITFYLLQFFFQNILVTAGKGVLGFIMTVVAGIANIVGDAILVGVFAKTPEASISGAAIATVVGLFIGGVIPFIYFLFKNSSFLRIGKPAMDIKAVGATCANGISEFFTNISAAILNTVFNGLLLYIVGQMGVSAFGAISYVNTIFCAIFMGYSIGIAPIISYKYGAKDYTELQSLYKRSIIILVVSSVAMVALGEILAVPLSSVFSGGDQALLAMTITGFRIYAISFIYKGINTFGSAFFTALNDGLVSGILAITRTLLFSVGAVLILPVTYYIIYGADKALLGIWWSVIYAEFLGLVLTIIFLVTKRKKYHYGK